MNKKDIIRKLSSRKLWMAIATFVSMLVVYFSGDPAEGERISALIMAGAAVVAYVVAEGLADMGNSDSRTYTDCSFETKNGGELPDSEAGASKEGNV